MVSASQARCPLEGWEEIAKEFSISVSGTYEVMAYDGLCFVSHIMRGRPLETRPSA